MKRVIEGGEISVERLRECGGRGSRKSARSSRFLDQGHIPRKDAAVPREDVAVGSGVFLFLERRTCLFLTRRMCSMRGYLRILREALPKGTSETQIFQRQLRIVMERVEKRCFEEERKDDDVVVIESQCKDTDLIKK